MHRLIKVGGTAVIFASMLTVNASSATADPPADDRTCKPGAVYKLSDAEEVKKFKIRKKDCDLSDMTVVGDNVGAAVPVPGNFVNAHMTAVDGQDSHLTLEVDLDTGDVTIDGTEQAEGQSSGGGGGTSTAFCGGTGGTAGPEYWHRAPTYYINAATYPRYASQADWVSRLQNAASTWRNSTNRCGYAQRTTTNLNLAYQGNTSRSAGISDNNICTSYDGYSVISGGALNGILGGSCRTGSSANTSITESDIKIDGFDVPYIAPGTPCTSGEFDLYTVAVHEFGHYIGLGHSGEASYPTLVMSNNIGACEYNRTLGAGDYARVSAKYYPFGY